MSNLDLSVIVLSFNTKDITDECLTRLKKAKQFCVEKLHNKIEVIVIENASSDGSKEMIETKHDWVRLIISKTNTGFSGGNNIAMKESKHPFILLLNSDAYVEENTLEKSLEYFASHLDCDVMGVQQRFSNGTFQPSGGFLPTPSNTVFWISGLSLLPVIGSLTTQIHPRSKDFFAKERQLEWVMGAFFMMKREVYEKTGGFDESIFMYGEEVEWCKRIKDQGFRTVYNPEIKIVHLDKASSKGLLEKPLLNEIKGIVRYFNQHYKKDWETVKIIMKVSLLLRVIAFSILGKDHRRRAYLEALSIL